MMTISLSDAGKRYNRDWIFRHAHYTFQAGTYYAITGPNGSGKSTLLQALGGSLLLNEGSTTYRMADPETPGGAGRELKSEDVYRHVAICAPYLELVEEMTLREFLDFHQGFKPFLPGVSTASIISSIGLETAIDKQIRYYSSGMKQRVKLAQCIFSDTSIVLLDEPCTNLDAAGVSLYNALIRDHCKKRMVIVSSNDHHEYEFCSEIINILNWK